MLRADFAKRFLRDRAGGIAIAAAIAAPVLLTLAAGAIDLHRAEATRIQLQDALDAAVLSGAGADRDGDETVAASAFAANNVVVGVTSDFTLDAGAMTGEADTTVETTFLQLVGVATLPVSAESLAVIGKTPCVLLLERNDVSALVNSGADLDARACPMHVNSANRDAVYANSGSTIRAESLCVNGGATANNSTIDPDAITGCAVLPDPLAGVPEPVVSGSCTDVEANGTGQTIRLPANRCWRNVTSNSGGTIVFEPGIHKITGLVQGNSQSTVTGTGVTLFFQGTDAKLVGNSRSTITLSAPHTGPTAGIVLWQSKVGTGADVFLMNSRVTGTLEGVVYLPQATLELNSDVVSSASSTTVISKKLILNSDSAFVLNADYANGPPLPRALRPIRLEH